MKSDTDTRTMSLWDFPHVQDQLSSSSAHTIYTKHINIFIFKLQPFMFDRETPCPFLFIAAYSSHYCTSVFMFVALIAVTILFSPDISGSPVRNFRHSPANTIIWKLLMKYNTFGMGGGLECHLRHCPSAHSLYYIILHISVDLPVWAAKSADILNYKCMCENLLFAVVLAFWKSWSLFWWSWVHYARKYPRTYTVCPPSFLIYFFSFIRYSLSFWAN